MSTEVCALGASELLDLFRRREVSPVEALESFAERIAAVDGIGHAFSALCLDRARGEALRAEREYREGNPRPLLGIPIAAKDMFDSAEIETSYGSALFAGNIPSGDAAAISQLREAGAILVGKTRTHEWAWGVTSIGTRGDSPRNPWDLDRIAGGSSGGSAVALALDEVPLALGSDTGGSVRIPAAFCGVVGHKPTLSWISCAGLMPLARSLDHVGVMARVPQDAALMMEVLGRPSSSDPSAQGRVFSTQHRSTMRGLLVGVCPDLQPATPAPSIQGAFDSAVETLVTLGADVVEVSLPEMRSAYESFTAIQRAEALHHHRTLGLYPERAGEYAEDIRMRLDAAAHVTLDDYLAAIRRREEVRAGFKRVFGAVDLLISLVSPVGPPRIGADEEINHFGRSCSLRDLVMPSTTPQNLAGVPACTTRVAFDDDDLPVGVQLTACWWQDSLALSAAELFCDATLEIQRRRPLVAGQDVLQ